MAEPNQHLTPPPVTIAKAPEDVPGDGHPLSDPNTSFTVLEYSSSPLHAETRKRSGPHPPPDPGNLGTLEEVDHGRRSLRTKSLQTISIMNGMSTVSQSTHSTVHCSLGSQCMICPVSLFQLESGHYYSVFGFTFLLVAESHCTTHVSSGSCIYTLSCFY